MSQLIDLWVKNISEQIWKHLDTDKYFQTPFAFLLVFI